jgi:hypothetical protein
MTNQFTKNKFTVTSFVIGCILYSNIVQIGRLTNWGKANFEIGFDDIVYILDGAKLFRHNDMFGISSLINYFVDLNLHSPFMSFIAFWSISVFGYKEVYIYIIFSLINFIILGGLLSHLIKSYFVGFLLVSLMWTTSLGDFISNNFRPDILWVTCTLYSTVLLSSFVNHVENKNLGFAGAGLFALASYIKPSYVAMQVALLFMITIFCLYILKFGRPQIRFKINVSKYLIFPYTVFMIPYLFFYLGPSIKYNLDIRKAKVWTPQIGQESFDIFLFNIKNLILNDFGVLTRYLYIYTPITLAIIMIGIRIVYFLKKMDRTNISKDSTLILLLIYIATSSTILILGTHQSPFFGFTSFFPFLALSFYIIGPIFSSISKMKMGASIVIVLLILQPLIGTRSSVRTQEFLKINKPNQAIAQEIQSYCRTIGVEDKRNCSELNIRLIGASDINDATINWELIKKGESPYVKPENYLYGVEQLKESAEKSDITIVLNPGLIANDNLPYNQARKDITKFFDLNQKWILINYVDKGNLRWAKIYVKKD